MRRAVAAVLPAVVLAALAGMASSAWAAPAWLVQPDLSATGENASVPDVAMSFSGDVIIAWQGSPAGGPVQVVQRAAGGAFSAPLQFGMASFDSLGTPQDAINDDGDAVVVWQEASGDGAVKFSVWAASRLAAGSFGAPVRVSEAGTSTVDPQVALNAAGDIVVAWGRRENDAVVVQAAVRPAGGTFSAPADVSAPAGRNTASSNGALFQFLDVAQY